MVSHGDSWGTRCVQGTSVPSATLTWNLACILVGKHLRFTKDEFMKFRVAPVSSMTMTLCPWRVSYTQDTVHLGLLAKAMVPPRCTNAAILSVRFRLTILVSLWEWLSSVGRSSSSSSWGYSHSKLPVFPKDKDNKPLLKKPSLDKATRRATKEEIMLQLQGTVGAWA